MPGFIHSVYSTLEGSETSVTSVDSTISDKPPIMSTLQGETHVFSATCFLSASFTWYLSLLSPLNKREPQCPRLIFASVISINTESCNSMSPGYPQELTLGRPGSFPSVDTGKNFSYPGSYCCIHLLAPCGILYAVYSSTTYSLSAIVLISYLKTTPLSYTLNVISKAFPSWFSKE